MHEKDPFDIWGKRLVGEKKKKKKVKRPTMGTLITLSRVRIPIPITTRKSYCG